MSDSVHPTLVLSILLAVSFAGCLGSEELQPPVASAVFTPDAALELVTVAEGLDRPVQWLPDPRTPGTFLVVEMGGTVRSVGDQGVTESAWLDIGDRLEPEHREQGLLGLALHPAFPDDPRVFVTYTAPDDAVVLAAFTAPASGAVDNTTEQVLLRVPQPKPYHNGGHIAFGPDGFLYAAFGDGGPQGDPYGHAQDLSTLLGTIIRIDVDHDTIETGTETDDRTGWSVPDDNPFVDREGRDEIWLYGLRNPWRFSFDPATGDLWVADVGFLETEEVSRVPAALGGGHNLGWPRWEGSAPYDTQRTIEVPVLFPVHEYPRQVPCSSVTGGHVHRGDDLPGLHGAYLFSDFCTGQIHALTPSDDGWETQPLLDTGLPVAGFGTGHDGAAYVLSFTGSVHRLAAAEPGV